MIIHESDSGFVFACSTGYCISVLYYVTNFFRPNAINKAKIISSSNQYERSKVKGYDRKNVAVRQ